MKKKGVIIVASILLVLCMAGTATAAAELSNGPELPTSIQVTKDNDASAALMSRLFGTSWHSISGGAAADDSGGSGRFAGLIVGMIGLMNLAAMFFVSVAVLYQWAIFSVNTAHEGKKLGGGMYNSLWIPVRQAFAFSLTVPVLNGLSLLNIVLLAAVSLSINLANAAWDWGGSYIISHSQEGIVDNSPPLIEDESLNLIQPLFQAVTISEAIKINRHDPNDTDHVNTTIKAQALPERVTNPAQYKSVELVGDRYIIVREPLAGCITVYVMPAAGMPLGQLGSVIINAPIQKHEKGKLVPMSGTGEAMQAVAEARVQAVIRMADDLRLCARDFFVIRGWFSRQDIPPAPKDGLRIAREYWDYISEQTAQYVEIIKQGTNAKSLLEKALDNRNGKSELGWVSAGLFSVTLAQAQKQVDEVVYGGAAGFRYPDTDLPDQGLIGDISRFFSSKNTVTRLNGWQLEAIRIAPRYAATELTGGRIFSSVTEEGDGAGLVNKALAVLFLDSTGSDGILATTISKFRSVDPIVNITDFGRKFYTLAGWLAVASVGGSVASFIPYIGDKLNAVINSPVITGGMMVSWSIGVTLYIVAPLTVISIWLYAILHWALRVVEASIAAPLWAASHLAPEGNGFAGSHARKGYILALDLFLRPTLLVIGACFATAIWLAIGWLFALIFSKWLNGFVGFYGGGLITELTISAIILIFFYYLYTKVFVALISTLPDRLMNWLGTPGAGGLGGEEGSGMTPLGAGGAAAAKGGSMAGQALSSFSQLSGKGNEKKDRNPKPKGDGPANITENTE